MSVGIDEELHMVPLWNNSYTLVVESVHPPNDTNNHQGIAMIEDPKHTYMLVHMWISQISRLLIDIHE